MYVSRSLPSCALLSHRLTCFCARLIISRNNAKRSPLQRGPPSSTTRTSTSFTFVVRFFTVILVLLSLTPSCHPLNLETGQYPIHLPESSAGPLLRQKHPHHHTHRPTTILHHLPFSSARYAPRSRTRDEARPRWIRLLACTSHLRSALPTSSLFLSPSSRC